jgi:hypothetical protein
MPAICWNRYFLEAQGYNVAENILFQDNQSAILVLKKNGKASSGKRTKHIKNIRYFFVTDCIRNKELTVEWCPTHNLHQALVVTVDNKVAVRPASTFFSGIE